MNNFACALALMFSSTVACAVDMPELIKKHCTSCHQIDIKNIAPASPKTGGRNDSAAVTPVYAVGSFKRVGYCTREKSPVPARNLSYEQADSLARLILGLSAALKVSSSAN